MPWSNQSGGPWGQKPQGPWGTGPQGGGGGGRQPDLEEYLRRGQDKLKGFLPGGGGGFRGIAVVVLGAVLLWLATGFYTVRPDEVGLNLVFGRYVGKTGEGLRYNFPYPVGEVIKPRVTTVNTIEIGQRTGDTSQRISRREVPEESLMLTGDENIVDINFTVQWQVSPSNPENYVFNLLNPDTTIKAVAESAMREEVGRRNIQAILTTDRGPIETEVRRLMQQQLDEYGAGVEIRQVQLQKVDPPQQVIDAFRDVQAARQDQDRMRNEAETYASRVVPEARGEASRIAQAAEGYRARVEAEARGAASRFTQVYETYKTAPAVTRERMFIETVEKLLTDADKIILDQGNGQQNALPILPLGGLLQAGQLPPRPATGTQQTAPRTQGAGQ